MSFPPCNQIPRIQNANPHPVSDTFLVFLITAEEQEYIDELVAVFPKALYVKHPRQKAFNVEETKTFQEVLPEREMSTNENLLWYLSDVYIFSNCKSILCTMNNGVYTAILWNGGQYEEIRFLGGKNETRKD